VAEQRRVRAVAADRRAVDLDERPAELALLLLELVDAPRELRLARPRRPHEQHRRGRQRGDAFDLRDELVERGVLRRDAGLEQRLGRLVLLREALRQLVEARQVEVDDLVAAGLVAEHAFAPARRPRLQQPRGEVPRLGQQEQADLRDVRAGRHVHEHVVFFGVEREFVGDRPQQLEDLLEVPRVAQPDHPLHDLGLRRHRSDVALHDLEQLLEALLGQQHEPPHQQVLVLAHRDVRPPVLPAVAAHAPVELGAEEADDGVTSVLSHCASFYTIGSPVARAPAGAQWARRLQRSVLQSLVDSP
jgi:hypothetical protein